LREALVNTFCHRDYAQAGGEVSAVIYDDRLELCLRACHPQPEFLEGAGAAGVQFLPSGYVAPLRVAHHPAEHRRQILQAVAGGGAYLPISALRSIQPQPIVLCAMIFLV
jgi:ATP-dependent DNA helicase RecG